MRSLRSLLLTCAVFAATLAALGPAGAAAAPTVAGTWSCCGSGGASEQSWTISESGGSLSGSASDSSGTFSPISGSISGTSVSIVTGPYTTDPGYTATFVGTIDGETMSGTWTSNGGQEGTWSATRTSGPSAEEEARKKAEEAKKKKEEEEKAGKRKSAIQVNCDAFDPGLPNEYFQCTAQVGDASGQSPAIRPTGSVAFALSSGAGGGFQGASTCPLVASQTGGPTSFCAVTYVPPLPGWIPIGSQPAISAAYSGDSVFTSSSGQPQNPISTSNPLSPASVFKALCVQAFSPACDGITPPPPFISDTCISLVGCGSGATGSGSGDETVTVSPDAPDLLLYASCPEPSGPLSECELRTYLESPDVADPDLKAKVQAQLNYNAYVNEVNFERTGILDSVQASLVAPANASFLKTQLENAISIAWTKQINELYDDAAKYGTDIDQRFQLSDTSCEKSPAPQPCKDYVASINQALLDSLERLEQKKVDLGVNVPVKPSNKAAGASTSRVHNTAKHNPRDIVLAASRTVTLAAGKKATMRLPIPALIRTKLEQALKKGKRTISAKLFVEIGTHTGAYAERTVPVKIKLVAKKPRPAAKKKKKKK